MLVVVEAVCSAFTKPRKPHFYFENYCKIIDENSHDMMDDFSFPPKGKENTTKVFQMFAKIWSQMNFQNTGHTYSRLTDSYFCLHLYLFHPLSSNNFHKQ